MLDGKYTLDDFVVTGKRVFCRLDINSPVNRETGGLDDTTRIRRCLPTIAELVEKKAKVVLLSHQGGDLEYHNFISTKVHSNIISHELGLPVNFVDDVCGPAAREQICQLENRQILMLDNVRYLTEEANLFENQLKLSFEEQSKTLLVRKLAPLCDYYVVDAFAAAHRSQPTLVGMPQVLPTAMGRLFEEEIKALGKIIHRPKQPCIFILGGTKIGDAFLIMERILKVNIADLILTGGLVGNVMLLAKGVELGQASEDAIRRCRLWAYVKQAQQLLRKFNDKIMIPVDVAFDNNGRREVPVSSLPSNWPIIDIGHETVALYEKQIRRAHTIFINGPMGVFEQEAAMYGTRAIFETVAHSSAFSVIGGGDSISAINRFRIANGFSYISTGGGALVRFLSGETLPVISALEMSVCRFPPRNFPVVSSHQLDHLVYKNSTICSEQTRPSLPAKIVSVQQVPTGSPNSARGI